MSDFSQIEFTVEDLKRPGWAASILLGALRNLPEGFSSSVLSHIDAMVEEGANEALREFTLDGAATLRAALESEHPDDKKMAMAALDSALWKFAYEFNGFVELYERARSSLIDQQFGVMTQLSMGAMQRLNDLERFLPASITTSITATMEVLSTNKVVSSFYQEFYNNLAGIAALSREVEDYSVEAAQFIRDFVRERFSQSSWFSLAQSAFDRPREPQSGSGKSLSI